MHFVDDSEVNRVLTFPILIEAIEAAARTARAVGTQTSLGERGRSIVSVALDLADDVTDGDVEIRALGGSWLTGAATVADAVDALLAQLDTDGYVAVMAYLDRDEHAELAEVATKIADRTGRPTTFGWGPRFLHSTGQFHKGGTPVGSFLQITAASDTDLDIPGGDFTFGELLAAQATGDAQVLAGLDRPVLRLHALTDAGYAAVIEALQLPENAA